MPRPQMQSKKNSRLCAYVCGALSPDAMIQLFYSEQRQKGTVRRMQSRNREIHVNEKTHTVLWNCKPEFQHMNSNFL